MTEDKAFGTLPTPAQLRWQRAADQLAPHLSLARAMNRTQFIVGTVSIIGVILGGFGLTIPQRIAGGKLQLTGTLLSAAVISAALASLLMAIFSLVQRRTLLAIGNLDAVHKWYEAEFTRLRWATRASWSLLISIAVAGAAVLYSLLTSTAKPVDIGATLQSETTTSVTKLRVVVQITAAPEDSTTVITVFGREALLLKVVAAGSNRSMTNRDVQTTDRGPYTAEVRIERGQKIIKQTILRVP